MLILGQRGRYVGKYIVIDLSTPGLVNFQVIKCKRQI